MKYRVDLSTTASVSTSVVVEAEDVEAAKRAATELAISGNVVWRYDGANDEDIEAVNSRIEA